MRRIAPAGIALGLLWSLGAPAPAQDAAAGAVIVDDSDPRASADGAWSVAGRSTPYGGSASYAKRSGTFTYAPSLPAGEYRVSLWWPVWSKLSTSVSLTVESAVGPCPFRINQASDGSRWVPLGTFELDPASTIRITADGSDWVCADAVKLELVAAEPPPDPPPPAPEGLVADAGDGVVWLDWQDVADADLAGYVVYRAADGDAAYAVLADAVSQSAWTDATVQNGTTYLYVVTALDAAGNESEASAAVSAQPVAPPPDLPPPTPTSLAAEAGDGFVVLDWCDCTEPDLAGYSVYRLDPDTPTPARIATGVRLSEYADLDVVNGTTYAYSVTAYDLAGGESAPSASVSATPTAPEPVDAPPPAPEGLAATAGDGTATLDWLDVAEADLAGYAVYRSTTAGTGHALIADRLPASGFTDTGLANGTTYYYTVTALDAGGNESLGSAEVAVTPQAVASTPQGLTLAWDPPTTNADGTPLDDLAGFRIYEGLLSRDYGYVTDVGNVVQCTLEGLEAGTYYFAVTAYDTSGNESDYSEELTATVP